MGHCIGFNLHQLAKKTGVSVSLSSTIVTIVVVKEEHMAGGDAQALCIAL
jgi:hypothetical protein